MKYIPLRVKTSYSILTSLIDIEKMILFCKKNNIDTIGICDNNLFGVMEFYTLCKKNNIKPVIGFELRFDNDLLLLYCKNYEGYQNLTRLIYIKENGKLDIDSLKKLSNNLICVTDNYDKYKNIYSDIYINNINEILCFNKEDTKYLKYLHFIKENKKITDDIDLRINDDCYFDFAINEICNEIADKCNIEFKYNNDLIPKYDVLDSKKSLENLCKKGLTKRLDGKITKTYFDRLMYELDIIDKMGFNDYFLIVLDFIRYAKNNNILVGPGRGSAASSLVSYSLGITEIDPIKYNLLFERFLNIERKTMPDIDTDFDASKRDMVIDYVRSKYGDEYVAPIITFSTLTEKQALRDLARIYNIDVVKIDKLNKIIGDRSFIEASKDERVKDYVKYNRLDEIYKISIKLNGLKRQTSINAAGVIISSKKLDSYIPLVKYNDHFISGITKDYIEDIGLFKMDFLSIKHLTDLSEILDSVNIKYSDININDEEILKIFTDGLTTGIFQFESPGMKSFLKELKPTKIDDIINAIALYRPGPMSNIPSFIKRRNHLEKVEYFDDSIKDILLPTYGIIIYQEQILMILNKLAGYSYGEADILRRAISKKNKEIVLKEKNKFIEKGMSLGRNSNMLNKIYDYIIPFAEYGFNKSHAVAYSFLALSEAYLKTYYKYDYMAKLLTDNTKIKDVVNECKIMNIDILKPDINLSSNKFTKEGNAIRYSLSVIGAIPANEILSKRDTPFIDFIDFVKRCYSKVVNKDVISSLIDVDAFMSFGLNHSTLHNNLDNIINYAELSSGISDGVIDKPLITEYAEYTKEELMEKEKNILGFYLSNHPTTKYKLDHNYISLNEVNKYLGKTIDVIGLVTKTKIVNTKNGYEMEFVTINDDLSDASVTIFPNIYEKIDEIKVGDILSLRVKIGKRKSEYTLELVKVVHKY